MAGRFSNIIPLRRSAILPGGLFKGKFNEVSCKVKNPRVEQEQVPLLPGKRVSVMVPAGIFNRNVFSAFCGASSCAASNFRQAQSSRTVVQR